jgi:hypothetical protein
MSRNRVACITAAHSTSAEMTFNDGLPDPRVHSECGHGAPQPRARFLRQTQPLADDNVSHLQFTRSA